MRSGIKTLICIVVLAFGLSSAKAIMMVAGLTFQDNAFADIVVASSGTYTLAGAGTLQAAVTGSSLNKYAFSSSPGAYIQLGFTDNSLVNGNGYDLALFDYGNASTFALSIGGITKYYKSVTDVGYTSVIDGKSYQINVAKINLDDFGIVAGTKIYDIKIYMNCPTNGVPTFGAAGALNSGMVPDAGATVAMLGLAFAGLALLKRKLQ